MEIPSIVIDTKSGGIIKGAKKTRSNRKKMYRDIGFKTVDENVEEYIMVCELLEKRNNHVVPGKNQTERRKRMHSEKWSKKRWDRCINSFYPDA